MVLLNKTIRSILVLLNGRQAFERKGSEQIQIVEERVIFPSLLTNSKIPLFYSPAAYLSILKLQEWLFS